MTVEEYHVGQLYSIAETSKNETGGGEGVEFVDSYSYTGNPIFFGEFPDGQYTQKVHHMARSVLLCIHWPRILSALHTMLLSYI